jgi:hypothetical protein
VIVLLLLLLLLLMLLLLLLLLLLRLLRLLLLLLDGWMDGAPECTPQPATALGGPAHFNLYRNSVSIRAMKMVE